jgi:hypothetical protein
MSLLTELEGHPASSSTAKAKAKHSTGKSLVHFSKGKKHGRRSTGTVESSAKRLRSVAPKG